MRDIPSSPDLCEHFLDGSFALEILAEVLVGWQNVVAVYQVKHFLVVGLHEDEVVHLQERSLLHLAIAFIELPISLVFL
jgi:flagellar biogenesis protein FliO